MLEEPGACILSSVWQSECKACMLLLEYGLEILPRGGHGKGKGSAVRTMKVHVEHSEGDLNGEGWPPDSRLGQMSDLT